MPPTRRKKARRVITRSQSKIDDVFLSTKSKKKQKKIPIVIKNEVEKKEVAVVPARDKDILLQFDLNWEYGPSIGITRLERWERADKLGLNPPQKVKDLILKTSNEDLNKCVWNKYYNIL